MQEHRIKPKCVPKTKDTARRADAIKYVFYENIVNFQNMKH
jgi:hypothetical protein